VAVLDLDYVEDSSADVDMNVAMTAAGKYVEIQGAAEQAPFDDAQMRAMLDLARKGIRKLIALQRQAIARKPA
jgi:ribonuclease PH